MIYQLPQDLGLVSYSSNLKKKVTSYISPKPHFSRRTQGTQKSKLLKTYPEGYESFTSKDKRHLYFDPFFIHLLFLFQMQL